LKSEAKGSLVTAGLEGGRTDARLSHSC